MHLEQGIVPLEHRDAVCAAQVDHLLAGHPVHAVIPGRGPNLAPAHDKEIAGIGRVHEPMRVEHQGLVRARLLGLKAGQNAVELGMRIVFRVLAHRQAAHLRDGRKPDARAGQAIHGLGMFHDDHQRRP